MGDEDVLRVGGRAAELGVEVGAAVLEAAVADDLHHREGEVVRIHRELVGIPAVLGVAAVGVDGAEEAVVHGHGELMLEGVAGEGGVVHLDVHLEVLVQAVGAEEADHGLRVHVVLVLGGLHRLGLDEEGALEALGAGVVAGRGEHLGEVVLLALHLGVQEGVVAFTAAPEHVSGAAELDGGVERILDLQGRAGDDVELRVGGGAVHVALVAEHVGRAPQVLDAGLLLLLQEVVGDVLHAGLVLLHVLGVLDQVDVMEAVVADAQLLHDLEAGVGLGLGAAVGALALVPLVGAGLAAERVAGRLAQGVPPGHRELEPVLHGLAHDHAVRVIIMESKGILALSALEGDLSDCREILFCHDVLCF